MYINMWGCLILCQPIGPAGALQGLGSTGIKGLFNWNWTQDYLNAKHVLCHWLMLVPITSITFESDCWLLEHCVFSHYLLPHSFFKVLFPVLANEPSIDRLFKEKLNLQSVFDMLVTSEHILFCPVVIYYAFLHSFESIQCNGIM